MGSSNSGALEFFKTKFLFDTVGFFTEMELSGQALL
jgi:hypothetical protein